MSRNRKILAALVVLIVFSLIAGIYFLSAATPKEQKNETKTPDKVVPVKLNEIVEPDKNILVWKASKCYTYPSENKNVYDLRADIKNSSAEVEFRITYFNENGNLIFGKKSSVFNLSPGHPISRIMASPYGAYELLPLNFEVYINKTFSEEKMITLTCEKESSSSSATTINTGSAPPVVSPTINPRQTQPPYTPPPAVNPTTNPTVKPTSKPTTAPTARPTVNPTRNPAPNPTPRQTCSGKH